MAKKNFPETVAQAEILLACVIFARSTSFAILKTCLASVTPFELIAIRSLIAFVLVFCLFYKRFRNINILTIFRGFILGILFFAMMALEQYSLKGNSTTTTALIENSALVIVPLVESVIRRKLPKPLTIICDLVALLGIFLLSYDGSIGFSQSDILCLLAAVAYTFCIIVTDRLSRKDDPIVLGILQVGFMGLFGLIASLIFDDPMLPSSGTIWLLILYLAVVCSGFGFTLQPLAQSKIPSDRVSLFIAISPLSAAVLGVVLLHEQFTVIQVIGALLIISAILITEIKNSRELSQASL